jgi:hypothetical protein
VATFRQWFRIRARTGFSTLLNAVPEIFARFSSDINAHPRTGYAKSLALINSRVFSIVSSMMPFAVITLVPAGGVRTVVFPSNASSRRSFACRVSHAAFSSRSVRNARNGSSRANVVVKLSA